MLLHVLTGWLSLLVVVDAVRLGDGPILKPTPSIGDNLNGPSLIRVPPWIEHPLGRYYLYFAHHNGTYIRLAYADRVTGPWKIHEPGTLRLEQAKTCRAHVASPDVHVDHQRREIRMYFHCPTLGGGMDHQKTFVALSRDGLRFEPRADVLGPSYFRVFRWRGYFYAIARGGEFFRSPDGVRPFEAGPRLFQGPNLLRHAAVSLAGGTLHVYHSRIGDSPERIYHATIPLTGDWMKWKASPEAVVPAPLRELRDPGIFQEGGRTYLLYSVAGESGIALALLP